MVVRSMKVEINGWRVVLVLVPLSRWQVAWVQRLVLIWCLLFGAPLVMVMVVELSAR
jgi:hypothetical protein